MQLWLFWLAPIVGAAIAGVVYPIVMGETEKMLKNFKEFVMRGQRAGSRRCRDHRRRFPAPSSTSMVN